MRIRRISWSGVTSIARTARRSRKVRVVMKTHYRLVDEGANPSLVSLQESLLGHGVEECLGARFDQLCDGAIGVNVELVFFHRLQDHCTDLIDADAVLKISCGLRQSLFLTPSLILGHC